MNKTSRTYIEYSLVLMLMLIMTVQLSALDFAILNRGEIIFQEILIETDLEENNYYFNFGINGLEPGARHNIHISTIEDLIFCSFYLFGISNENYIIENVAIEQNSIVYILPEHYQEEMDIYQDMDNPDAVYGAMLFDRSKYIPVDEESPENQYRTEMELFNYTNSPIFRIYCKDLTEIRPDPVPEEILKDVVIAEGKEKSGPENLLHGMVLQPQESITLELVLLPDREYSIQLKGSENILFEKKLSNSPDSDFLVFYDSDILSDWVNLSLEIHNMTVDELKEIYLIDQESGKRVELLQGTVMAPESILSYLLTEELHTCDIIIRTASNQKLYIFDWNLLENPLIKIDGN